jgi:glycosyl transferase family 87
MSASGLERLGNRIVTLRRARAVAAITVTMLTVTYGAALARRHGRIDGFGHVIGGDLLEQRVASMMVRDGRGDRLYDFELQARYEQAAVAPDPLPGLNPFMGPPYVAILYWPLMPLGHEIAFAVWSALGLACLIASLLALARDYGWLRHAFTTALLLSLSFFPVVEGMMAGSNQMVSLLLLTVAFLLLKRERDFEAGVVLGLQLFKPQLAIATLAVLLVKGRWKALSGVALVATIWIAVSVLFVSPRSPIDFLDAVPALARLTYADGFPSFLLSSVYALFSIPLGSGLMTVSNTLGAIASLAVIGLLLRMWRGPWNAGSSAFDRRFAATLIATPLVSQYFLLHDVSILIVAAVLLADGAVRDPATRGWGTTRLALAALWIACFAGPLLTMRFHLPIVPIALLFVGWSVYASSEAVTASSVALPAAASLRAAR